MIKRIPIVMFMTGFKKSLQMKRFVVPILLAFFLLASAAVLLYYFELFHMELSLHNTYQLTAIERGLIEGAVQRFRGRVKDGKFEEIRHDLSIGRRDAYWEEIILNDLRADTTELGDPISWNLFNCAQPQIDQGNTIYHLDYLTTFTAGERLESIILSRDPNDHMSLVSADIGLPEATQWRIAERDRHSEISKKFPREIFIPLPDRYLEIRY